jgi:hypothetical protein
MPFDEETLHSLGFVLFMYVFIYVFIFVSAT